MVQDTVATQEKADTVLMKARDYFSRRDEDGRVRLHRDNPFWTKLAIEQGAYPDFNMGLPHVKRYLRSTDYNLCPEPECRVRMCKHNLFVYAKFVEITDQYDAKKEFGSSMGLSRFKRSYSDFNFSLGDNYQSGQ